MNLGLLGIDPSTATVAAAALRGGVRIPVACDLPAGVAPLEPSPRSVSWEHLLDPATCDAVLVASSDWSDDRAEVVRKLHTATNQVLQRPELRQLMAKEGTDVEGSKSPEEFAAFTRENAKLWQQLARDTGAKVD